MPAPAPVGLILLIVVLVVPRIVAGTVLYPLAIVDVERTAFWMQLFYLAILSYTCVLVVGWRLLPLRQKGDARE